MSEWWKYTISDFLLFAPRTYYRLIERYNEAVWPAHLLALGVGIVVIWLLLRPGAWQGRMISAAVAILWAWVAGAFLWRRYATINWAASYFALAFAVEAGILAGFAAGAGGLSFRFRRDAMGVIGLGLLLLALVLYPVFAPLFGRHWQQAEIFGMAPDPTAIGTIGLFLPAEGIRRWWVLAVPVLWCVLSAATLWAMGSPEAWVLLMGLLGALGARARAGRVG